MNITARTMLLSALKPRALPWASRFRPFRIPALPLVTNEGQLGIYSNLAIITHSSSEFVMDFVRVMPGIPKANVKSRIILTPEHAKRLMLALQENIQKCESANGSIKNVRGHDPMILKSSDLSF